ncbi:MAG: ATP-binding cassette domain-containing protein [Clostridia bacterium]|nr:ATP-binding cassette domain-containing protein [Clostridia bacterium]
MSLLSLRDIGKIYVSEGAVAVGLRNVNLDFNIGEFVAVTGKSGSGKTTLLNMISGMDTYEEGELYIEGEPTSHYEQADWERYREKYISFIFQDYNIIESFTVLQNVELALSFIDSPKERRQRALKLIERVGLTKFKNHKGSKLSGGQKQRTVIARALAKNSPIILADEPTGNLDAKTSEEIVELLAEISQDKLVIVVTHSAAELEKYATREIRIFDGTVERDEILRSTQTSDRAIIKESTVKSHIFRRGMELGLHRFKAMPKLSAFMCMLMVLAMLGTFFATVNATVNLSAQRRAFVYRKGRLIISRQDGAAITDEELEKLSVELGAKSFSHYDYLYDTPIGFSKKHAEKNKVERTELYVYVDDGKINPKLGRAPETRNEVMLVLPIGWKNIYGNSLENGLKITLGGSDFEICGVDYFYDNTKQSRAVLTQEGFDRCTDAAFICGYSFGNVEATNETILVSLPSYDNTLYFNVYVDDSLGEGEAYISALDHRLVNVAKGCGSINVDFRWTKYNVPSSVSHAYRHNNLKIVSSKCFVKQPNTEFAFYEDQGPLSSDSTDLYVSRDTLDAILENLRDVNYTQASLFFKNDAAAEKAAEDLREDGYYAVTSDHTFSQNDEKLLLFILGAFEIFGWVITMLFLSLFLYICSVRAIIAKRSDIAIMRSMGIEVKVIKISMYSQTGLAMIPSFIALVLAALCIYTSPDLNSFFRFLHLREYLMIIVGMFIINVYVSTKYNKKMFKDSVRKTLRGGGAE